MKRLFALIIILLGLSGGVFAQSIQTVGEPADTLVQAHIVIDSTMHFRSKPITPFLISLSADGYATSASLGDTSVSSGKIKDAAISYAKLAQALKDSLAKTQTHINRADNPHAVTATQVLPSQAGNSGKALVTNGTSASWQEVSTSEVDGVVGNEVANVTNSTLVRSGSGTSVSPYTLGINLANANLWSARQGATTFYADSGKYVYLRINNAYTLPTAAGSSGQFLSYNGAWATPTTTGVTEGTNLYYTDARARAAISSSATGLTYTSSTGAFSFATGYSIPTTASQSDWGTAYTDRMKWDGGATGLTAATGRTSLGLKGAAILDVGTASGTVAAGDHTHSGVYEPAISTLGLSKGGTNNTSYTSGKFLAYDGTKLASTSYDNNSFATAGHAHSGTYEPANANIQSHISSTSNPHSVTATQVLPSQTGNSGKVLGTNGTVASWVAASSGTGDIEGVNVTSPITGGGSSGTVTIGADTTESAAALATKGWVQRQGYGVGGGDITAVNTGAGLTGGNIAGDLTISVKLSANGGLQTTSDSLGLKLDGATLTKSSLGLKVTPNTFASYSHNHAASEINSGTLVHERGGLEADISAYDGLVKVSGGSTSYIADGSSNWGTAYTDRMKWDGGSTGLVAATGRTSLGLGGAAVLNVGTSSGTVAAGDHSHSGVYEPANANIQSHISSTSNPHSVTATQVLPAQAGNGGKVLATNGTSASWASPTGSIVLSANGGLQVGSDSLGVKLNGSSLTKSSLGLKVTDNTYAAYSHDHASTYAPIGAKFIVQTADASLTGEQALGALATGILKNTTTTGVLSIAVAGTDYLAPNGSAASLTDFPTLNQNTTGSAAKWTTARTLAGNSVDGSVNVAFSNKFIAQGTSDAGLSGAQFLGSLATGILKNTTTTGVLSVAVAGTDYLSPTLSSASIFIGNASNVATATAISGDMTITNGGVVSLAANAADSTNLADGSVTSETIKDGQVKTADLAANAVDSTKVLDGAITSESIRDGQVKTVDLAANAVDSTKVKDGAITSESIQDGQVKLVDLQAQTSANWATKVSDETGSGAMVFATSPTITGANLGVVAGSVTSGEIRHLRFTLIAPNAAVTSVGSPYNIPIWVSVDSAITVTRVRVTCDADPTTEIAGDLKYADAFIGLANAAVINDFDTSSGVRDDNTITSASVAAGKCLYISFDAVPESALKTIAFDVMYYYQ